MDNEQIAVKIAELSTVMKEVRDDVKEIKEDAVKPMKADIDSLKQSRSRLRGVLSVLGIAGGAGAGEAAGLWARLFSG